MDGKGDLWILPRQHAVQKDESLLVLLGISQLDMTASTVELDGWPNLLCHRIKLLDKEEQCRGEEETAERI